MATQCPILRNVNNLAYKKGLLPEKKRLVCEFEGKCDQNQVNCRKSKEPIFRTIYLEQTGIDQRTSVTDKFYRRAELSLELIRRERG